MSVKIIKDPESYRTALAEISDLMDKDPIPGTKDSDRLELLSLLVERYEKDVFSSTIPDPIEAIKFRMSQQNLSQADLIPYLGSRSKVSEILSKKRPLSLAMIRALNSGLGIPAEILVREDNNFDEETIEWDRFPLKEMIARGWVKAKNSDTSVNFKNTLKEFFAPTGNLNKLAALHKKNDNIRSARSMDKYALAAWTARVLTTGLSSNIKTKYEPGTVNLAFMQEVSKLSYLNDGPRLVQEFLAKYGVALVIETHLPQTYLDGAAIMINTDRPVIGLTLRYDRLDNFWFTLMHELAHIALHFGQGFTYFYDDLDIEDNEDPREKEADYLAGEALIPKSEWDKSPVSVVKSPQAVEQLSKKLRISPAIIAGRLRKEYKSYHILNNLVGHGLVRKMFDEN